MNEVNLRVREIMDCDVTEDLLMAESNGQSQAALPNYAGDIAAAWLVVEFMRKKTFAVRSDFNKNLTAAVTSRLGSKAEDFMAFDGLVLSLEPIDICKAALKTLTGR